MRSQNGKRQGAMKTLLKIAFIIAAVGMVLFVLFILGIAAVAIEEAKEDMKEYRD
jgi:flagellar basal body-associated protein FliL